jgi:CheY-like chemotaxis protein
LDCLPSIGLAVAQKLVLEHHGHIVAESEGPGRGSRFTIRLPLAAAQPRALTRQDTRAKASAVGRRILVADDNRDLLELMQEMLEHHGHEIRIAYNGPDAVQICEEFKPDIVFLDIGLPGLNGYEVAKQIRKGASCTKMQIVAVTGFARDADRTRALESGFNEHVAKPIDFDRISKLLQKL